ncbi:hypothetical protein [Photorhabdus kayaii]|uniref:hypothetical protein n=1 Tax=Photorhabdus kayaii TaxID=230088 RepID=UPI0021D49A75|nr:hypothetical protein [Photorhabdus kayaii]MCT8351852.1 hypothetical protein [Photorhabdus kayaii]
MRDISITYYLGPGVYLLYNYSQQSGFRIAEKGYKVYHCDDFSILDQLLSENKFDYLLINDDINKFDEYHQILNLVTQSSIKKIAIDTMVTSEQSHHYFELIKLAYSLNYQKDTAFYSINNDFDDSFNVDWHLQILLKKHDGSLKNQVNHEGQISTITLKKITKILEYVRPGDRILVISESNNGIDKILLEETKASKVDAFSLMNVKHSAGAINGYHFIVVDDYEDKNISDINSLLVHYLLPAGRCVFFNTNMVVLNSLNLLNFQLEVYYYYEHNYLRSHTYHGEQILCEPELCVLMRNPLEQTVFSYEESIYGYASPPQNLLAFARDYNNPWLIRGLVEFPFRNRSAYHLKNYSLQIINHYDPVSPDYAAALAVLGYQLLNSGNDYDDVLNKILLFCSTIANLPERTPHQNRWYISLSTLAGLIYNKNNEKTKALVHFSRASNVSFTEFSPSIGTKTLQSLYFQTIIFISLNKINYAEMTVVKGIKRGIELLYQRPDELIGKISHPFNFVMYIYHDIIDWIIKLINVRNSLSSKKFSIANHDNNNTWSSLLHERMNAINSMSKMIGERDEVIYAQKDLIDQLNNKINHQSQLISERDTRINDFLEINVKKDQIIAEKDALIQELSNLNKNNDQYLSILATKLERAESVLRKINDIPLIGIFLRKLNIK